MLYVQLVHHKSQSVEQIAALNYEVKEPSLHLLRQSHQHWALPYDKKYFQAIRSLQSNNDILITKPDKDAGVIILNKHDYVLKIDTLHHNASKLENHGLAS